MSASTLPRAFSHCQSTSASGGLTTAVSGKKPPGTCTSGGSDAEPAWISIVLSGSDAVTASWAAPALVAAEHMSRGYVAHVRVSGRRLPVNVRDVSGRRLLVNAPTRTRQTAVAITERIVPRCRRRARRTGRQGATRGRTFLEISPLLNDAGASSRSGGDEAELTSNLSLSPYE